MVRPERDRPVEARQRILVAPQTCQDHTAIGVSLG
jgi:hypothetical protein